MNSTTHSSEQQKNFEVARRINREARADPNSIYVGKVIGVWRGEVVAVADTLGEVVNQSDELPAPEESVRIEADANYDSTYMIRGCEATLELALAFGLQSS